MATTPLFDLPFAEGLALLRCGDQHAARFLRRIEGAHDHGDV